MSQESAPLIGMPARIERVPDRYSVDGRYVGAIAAAGGIPILVPLLGHPERIVPVAKILSGVLLTGSSTDVDPSHYGAQRHPACGPSEPLRDQTDFVLLSVARQRRIPVLGICFGAQSLNVFMGGSLVQDIPSCLPSGIAHRQSSARFAHTVEMSPGSLLEQLAGGTAALVNSTHHQALERVGAGLQVTARAPDGVIEAVAGTDGNQWILGVQWHPEKSYDYDEFSRKIFATFIAQCRAV